MSTKSYFYLCICSANLISFIVGMSLSWSSPILAKLEDVSLIDDNPLTITKEESSWIGSLLSLGAACGPFLFAFFGEWKGRKPALFVIGIPFLISYLVLAFAEISALYMVARFLAGLSLGGMFTILPQYIAEMSEDETRGFMGSTINVFLCTGLLLSYAIGPYLSVLVFNIIIAIVAAAFLVSFIFLSSETPQWLVSKNREADAKAVLMKIRNTDAVDEELRAISNLVEASSGGSFKDLGKRSNVRALIISISLASFQQLSGVNVVLFYAQNIFSATGSTIPPEISSMIIGAVQFASSFISPPLADRLGRKILFIISAIGMLVAEVALGIYFYLQDDGQDVDGISWLPVVSLVAYIITYNCAFGPLPWTVMAELFPPNVKNIASSLTVSICWFLSFIITRFFPDISNAIGMGGSFWIFAAFNLVALVFVIMVVPETKGKSETEIQEMLNRRK